MYTVFMHVARKFKSAVSHECLSAMPINHRGLFFVIPVGSPVATFDQSENVAIAHLVGARATAYCEGCGLCNN